MRQQGTETQPDASTKAALQALASGSRNLHLPCNLRLPVAGEQRRVQAIRQLRLLPAQRWVVAVRFESAPVTAAAADSNIDPQQGLLKLFVGPKARRHQARELAAAKRLAQRGVMTPPLLEHGGWLGDDQATGYFLLYAWVAGEAPTATPNQAEFCRIVQAVAELHNQGLQQTDMHLGNFLLAQDRVYAVDASDIQELPSGRRQVAAALDNLAVLFAQQPVAAAQTQLADWVSVYQRKSTVPGLGRAANLAPQMVERTHGQRFDRVRRYLQKSLRDCSEFQVEKSAGRRFVCVRQDMGAGLAAFAKDPEGTMAQGQVLKAGNTATVVLIVVIIGGLGSIRGTILAALLIGLSDGIISVFFSPTLAKILATLLVALVLVFRPQGLFGGQH